MADAAAMRAALMAHDEVLRSSIEAHDGFLFSHTGDGVVAAFASPSSAIDAAVAAQRALDLPVRMGVATGEAELRDGDYFGTVLNRAARVMTAGHGGQILVADSTAGLLSGVDLVDVGPRRLRDLPNPVTVFQLQAAGPADAEVRTLTTRLERLGGLVEMPSDRRFIVITVPVAVGFPAIEQAVGEWAAGHGCVWGYGNVYDEHDNPLGWWMNG